MSRRDKDHLEQGSAQPGPGCVVRQRVAKVAVAFLLIATGILSVVQGLRLVQLGPDAPVATPRSNRPGERLVPTPTALAYDGGTELTRAVTAEKAPHSSPVEPGATPTSAVTMILEAKQAAVPLETEQEAPGLLSSRQRIGVAAPLSNVNRYDMARLGAGWYVPCDVRKEPSRPAGMECVQLVITSGDTYRPDAAALADAARHYPGTLWLVGNEPDVIWQGNATPEEYARAYHDVYTVLKEADPTCQVGIGGISQVTPLRLGYLDAVLAAYEESHNEPIPVDVWNIHLAILREERGSWGVDIPPGLPDDAGVLYEIEDNADVEILKAQVFAFRHWMWERGLRDKPLIVTEFSVLMPPEYGFPFERVRGFMIAAFDFLMTATDADLGYPVDANRLVQRMAWYSIADNVYFTGNLFDPETARLTPLGEAFAEYSGAW